MVLLTKAKQKEFERHLANLTSLKKEYESESTKEAMRRWTSQFIFVYRNAITLEQLELLKQMDVAPNSRYVGALDKQIRLRKRTRVVAKKVLKTQLLLLRKSTNEDQRKEQLLKLMEFIEKTVVNHDVLLGILDALSEDK